MSTRASEIIGKIVAAAIVLLLLAGVVTALYVGIDRFVDWVANMDRAAGIALLICFTVFLSARTLSNGLSRSRSVDEEERLRRRRANIYRRSLAESLTQSGYERVGDSAGINHDLLLWGSPEVIRCYLDVRQTNQRGPNYAKAVEAWLRAIRDDLGSRNGRLQEGDLFALLTTNRPKVPEESHR